MVKKIPKNTMSASNSQMLRMKEKHRKLSMTWWERKKKVGLECIEVGHEICSDSKTKFLIN